MKFIFEAPYHKKIDPDILIVRFDFTRLCKIIPHKLGKQVISFWIEKYWWALHRKFNRRLFIENIELILNNNYFWFDNKNYSQHSEPK